MRGYNFYDEGFFAAIIVIAVIALAIGLIVMIFYLLNLQNLMNLVAPENRKMNPGQVWLLLIPFFGLVWNFIMVDRIADSVGAELRARQLPHDDNRPGYQVGLWMAIMNAMGVIPTIGGLFGLAGLVLFIVYWVKMAGYKKQLEVHNQFSFQTNPNPNNTNNPYQPNQNYPPNQNQNYNQF